MFGRTTAGSFNSTALSGGCARGTALRRGNVVTAVTLRLEDTRGGENRTLLFLLNDPNGLRANSSFRLASGTALTGVYGETRSSDNRSEVWDVSSGSVVVEAVTATSIRYRFQGNFRPRTSSQSNGTPGTGTFSLSGTASSTLTDG